MEACYMEQFESTFLKISTVRGRIGKEFPSLCHPCVLIAPNHFHRRYPRLGYHFKNFPSHDPTPRNGPASFIRPATLFPAGAPVAEVVGISVFEAVGMILAFESTVSRTALPVACHEAAWFGHKRVLHELTGQTFVSAGSVPQ